MNACENCHKEKSAKSFPIKSFEKDKNGAIDSSKPIYNTVCKLCVRRLHKRKRGVKETRGRISLEEQHKWLHVLLESEEPKPNYIYLLDQVNNNYKLKCSMSALRNAYKRIQKKKAAKALQDNESDNISVV